MSTEKYDFLDNRYRRIYFALIQKAMKEERNKNKGLYEKHHIIPRSLGGSNLADNLVFLTPREHYVAHLLLCKILHKKSKQWYKMIHALRLMTNILYPNSRKYEWIRTAFIEDERKRKIGVKRSKESVDKQISTIKEQYKNGKINNRTGSTITENHKNAIRDANKGKAIPEKSRTSLAGFQIRYGENDGLERYLENNKTKAVNTLQSFIVRYGEEDGPIKFTELKKKLSVKLTGKLGTKHTEETKQHLKRIQLNIEKKVCEKCGIFFSPAMLARWHGNKCKIN